MDAVSIGEVLSAAVHGDVEKLRLLAEEDPNCIDLFNEEGCSPLMYAAANGRESAIRYLLANEANVERRNRYGWTALLQACYYGHTSVVGVLLERGASVHSTNHWGATPLLAATQSQNLTLVKMLVSHGASVNLVSDSPTSFTPLMAAVQSGNEGITAVLLNNSADQDVQMKGSKFTALMFATLNGHANIVRQLLRHNANKELVSSLGHKAVNIAWAIGREDIVKLLGYSKGDNLSKASSPPSAVGRVMSVSEDIFSAVKLGDSHLRDICQLLTKEVDCVNARDSYGATPLMYAAMRGYPQTCNVLLEKGADVNAQDSVSGWTAFMQAVHHNQYISARILLSSGASIDVKAKDGCTALQIATYNGDIKMMQLISQYTQRDVPSSSSKDNLRPSESGELGNLQRWMKKLNVEMDGQSGGGIPHQTRPVQPPSFAISLTPDIIIQRVSNSFGKGIEQSPSDIEQSPSDIGQSPPNMEQSPGDIEQSPGDVGPSPVLPSGSRSSTVPADRTQSPTAVTHPSGRNRGAVVTPSFAMATLPSSSGSTKKMNMKRPQLTFKNQMKLSEQVILEEPADTLAVPKPPPPTSKKEVTTPILTPKTPPTPLVEVNLTTPTPESEQVKSVPQSDKLQELLKKPANWSHSHHMLASHDSHMISEGVLRTGSHIGPAYSQEGHRRPPKKRRDEDDEVLPDTVDAILNGLHLEQYLPIMQENEIDVETFLTMSDEDLEDVGIENAEHRLKFLNKILKLNRLLVPHDDRVRPAARSHQGIFQF